MLDDNLSGEVQDWNACCLKLAGKPGRLLWNINYMLATRGKQERTKASGTRVPYTFLETATEEEGGIPVRHRIEIAYATGTTGVLADEITPGRFNVITGAASSSRWFQKRRMGSIALANGYMTLAEGDDDLTEIIVAESAKVSAPYKETIENLVNLYEKADYMDSWSRISADDNMWVYDKDLAMNGIMGAGGIQAASYVYAGAPSAVPLGAEFHFGVVEIGVFLSMMVDIRNRINGAIRGGTRDEVARARTSFMDSFIRRSGQRGHMPNWKLVKTLVSSKGEAVLSAGGGASIPSDVTSVANDLIRGFMMRSGSDASPILM